MKKLSFILAFYFLIAIPIYSQKGQNELTFVTSTALMKNKLNLRDLASKTTHSYDDWFNPEDISKIEGSMYLYDDFRLGSMVLKNDTMVEGVKYRLNIYTKQMEMFYDNDTFALIKPEIVKNIYFDRKSFIYTSYEEDGKIGFDYFQVLVEGKYNLFIHYKAIIVPKNEPDTPLYAGSPNDKFVQFNDYFCQTNGMPATELSKNSKDIINLFSDKKTQVDKYIKENNLKARNDNNLVKIFQYYNSLK